MLFLRFGHTTGLVCAVDVKLSVQELYRNPVAWALEA